MHAGLGREHGACMQLHGGGEASGAAAHGVRPFVLQADAASYHSVYARHRLRNVQVASMASQHASAASVVPDSVTNHTSSCPHTLSRLAMHRGSAYS